MKNALRLALFTMIFAAALEAAPPTHGLGLGSTLAFGASGDTWEPSVRLHYMHRYPLGDSAFLAGWLAGFEWAMPRAGTSSVSNGLFTLPCMAEFAWRAVDGDFIVRPALGLGPWFSLLGQGATPPLFGASLALEAKLELGIALAGGRAFLIVPAWQFQVQGFSTGTALIHSLHVSVAYLWASGKTNAAAGKAP